jgi:NADH-quinone oxidoreductase subunit N
MGFQLNELNLLMPEVFLLVGVSIVLVVDLFLPESKRRYSYLLTQAVLLLSAVLAVGLFGMQPTEIMSGLVVIDDLGTVLKICVCLLLSAGLKYSAVFLGPRELFKGEYFTLTLFAALGMMVMISANHLVALYLGLELLSLSLYAMVALRRA